MARISKTGGRGQQIHIGTQKSKMGKQGIPQTADAKKTKNVNVLQGITPLELGSSSMENMPMGSLRGTPLGRNEGSGDTQIGKHSSGKASWADIVKEEAEKMDEGDKSNQEYPTEVRFENEVGKIIEQKIEYE
ncbi:hypothetical protein RDI58_021691 [Solanum bulbocastanum]|uniref:Uncharacterized protein n=1 Tax=Solanum bulbocastanum TaxID=147425 RepID=A0AAN8T6Q1_SOLBU